jgi:hypothetical protein
MIRRPLPSDECASFVIDPEPRRAIQAQRRGVCVLAPVTRSRGVLPLRLDNMNCRSV